MDLFYLPALAAVHKPKDIGDIYIIYIFMY